MPDQEIKCAERGCEEVINFTERDQEFYADHNPPWPAPKRCPEHRAAKRQRIDDLESRGQQV